MVRRNQRRIVSGFWDDGLTFTPSRGHSSVLKWFQKSDPIIIMGVDVLRPVFNLETEYGVTMFTREEWTRRNEILSAVKGLVWFTDGSRTAEGTGAGVYGQFVGRWLSISVRKACYSLSG